MVFEANFHASGVWKWFFLRCVEAIQEFLLLYLRSGLWDLLLRELES